MTRRSRNFQDRVGYDIHPDENLPMACLIGLLLAAAFLGGLLA